MDFKRQFVKIRRIVWNEFCRNFVFTVVFVSPDGKIIYQIFYNIIWLKYIFLYFWVSYLFNKRRNIAYQFVTRNSYSYLHLSKLKSKKHSFFFVAVLHLKADRRFSIRKQLVPIFKLEIYVKDVFQARLLVLIITK